MSLIRPNIIPNVIDNIQSDLDRNLIGEYGPVATITTTKVGVFSMTLRGYAGTLKVNWADGSAPEIVTLLGTGTSVVVNHTYVLAGEKRISIYEQYENVTYFSAQNGNIIYFDFKILKSLSFLNFGGNQVSSLQGLPVTPTFNDLLIHSNQITDIRPILAFPGMIRVWILGNPLNYTGYTWPAWSGNEYRLDSTVTTPGEVDLMLQDAAAGGVNNCTLELDGTNPARTTDSDQAVLDLLDNGVTLHVNT